MKELDLELFTSPGDVEAKQYRILAQLNFCLSELRHNKLYPILPQLITLSEALKVILESPDALSNKFPRRLVGVNQAKNRLVFKSAESDAQMDAARRLIKWALPKIIEIIDEGVTVHKFVFDSLIMTPVGIQALNIISGYWLVQDPLRNMLHFYKYQRGLYIRKNERRRALNFIYMDACPLQSDSALLRNIKDKIIEPGLFYNGSSTFITETDLEFSFEQTILPIAKKKFIVALST